MNGSPIASAAVSSEVKLPLTSCFRVPPALELAERKRMM